MWARGDDREKLFQDLSTTMPPPHTMEESGVEYLSMGSTLSRPLVCDAIPLSERCRCEDKR